MSKLYEKVATCSEQTANQNTNIAAEVCKVVRKRISGLTVREENLNETFDIIATDFASEGSLTVLLFLLR